LAKFLPSRTFSKLRELGESIARDGLVQPITVRTKENRFELIAGERRYRAAKEVAGLEKIMARIVYVDDHAARRMCATENMQRDDLSAIEEVEAKVEIIDAEFGDDSEYIALGSTAGERVRRLLGRLHSTEWNDSVSDAAMSFRHKFMSKVESVFSGLPKPVEWRSFYNNDLGITSIPENIKQWAATNKLNKSQTKTLAKLANMKVGDNQHGGCANLHTQTEAADLLNVGTRSVAPITNLLSDRRPDQVPHGNTGSGDR
jgi:hypothetical protein